MPDDLVIVASFEFTRCIADECELPFKPIPILVRFEQQHGSAWGATAIPTASPCD